MMFHTRSFVQFGRTGVLYAISCVVVTFFMELSLMLYQLYVNGFDRSCPKRAHSGIRYSMDDEFECRNGLKRCITYNAPARITHTLFWKHFDYQAETMQCIEMNG